MEKAFTDTKAQLKSTQERYKRKLDKRIRKNDEEFKPEDQVYLRMEKKNNKDSKHKLASVVNDHYPMKKVDKKAKTLVIERPDRSMENISRNRILLRTEHKDKK